MSFTDTRPHLGRVSGQTPNWQTPVSEKYTFKTRIETFRNGAEQRIAQRLNPRIEVSFKSDKKREAAHRVHADAQSIPTDGPMVMGAPWRKIDILTDIAGGETSITLDGNAPWWLVEGGYVVIESDGAREAAAVSTVAGSTVTFAEALTFAHGASAWATWGLYGLPVDTQKFQSVVANQKGGIVQFQAKPGYFGAAKPATTMPVLDDIPVLALRPNFAAPVRLELNDLRELVDYDYGPTDEYWVNKQIQSVSRWTFTGLQASKVDELIGFFHLVRGRQKPFWGTSHLRDFEQIGTAATGTNTLTVAGDYSAYVDDPTHVAVHVRFADGAVQINPISGIAVVDGVSTITFTGTWGRDVDEEPKISWAYLSRFASDALEIDWITDQVANASIITQAVRFDSLDLDAGPPVYQVPFTYGGFGVPVWNTDIEGWGQIDLGSELTAADIAAGRGSASATYSGVMVYAPGLNIHTGRVNVGFFDANGSGLSPPDAQDWSWSEPRAPAPQDNPFDFSFGPVTPPERTRYIRFGGITFQGSEGVSGLGTVTIGRAGSSSFTSDAGEGALIQWP